MLVYLQYTIEKGNIFKYSILFSQLLLYIAL